METTWASEYSEALPEADVIVYLQVPYLMDICSVCCKTQINHTSKFLRAVALYVHKKPCLPSCTLSSPAYVRDSQRARERERWSAVCKSVFRVRLPCVVMCCVLLGCISGPVSPSKWLIHWWMSREQEGEGYYVSIRPHVKTHTRTHRNPHTHTHRNWGDTFADINRRHLSLQVR